MIHVRSMISAASSPGPILLLSY